MLYATDDYKTAMTSLISQSYIKLEILDKDDNVLDEITTDVAYDDIGDISVDGTSEVHRSFSITLNNHSGRFIWGEDKLVWIDKKKARLYIGFMNPLGEIEYISQGVFILTNPQCISTPTEVKTIINGQDQWYYLTGNFGKYVATTYFDAYEKDENGDYIVDDEGYSQLKTEKDADGEPLKDADGNLVYYRITNYIKSILENVGIKKYIIDDCDAYLTTDLTYEAGENRGTTLKDLVARCYTTSDKYFYECYFDVNGYFRFQKVMKPTEVAPCETYEIKDVTMYAGSTRTLDESTLFNDIVVRGGSNNTTEFCKRIVVDEEAYLENKYGDATRQEFKEGTMNNIEVDALGRMKLFEYKEEQTVDDNGTEDDTSDDRKEMVGIGEYAKTGTFTSRWFDIGADAVDGDGNAVPVISSNVSWIQVLTNKTEAVDGVTVKQTLSVTVESSNNKTDILSSKVVSCSDTTKGVDIPVLTVGSAVPKYIRYKITMTSEDDITDGEVITNADGTTSEGAVTRTSFTPVLTNLQFAITVDYKPWVGHPYSIQKIGCRTYIWNDGIDSNIDTQAQCNARAQYELERNLAYTETVELQIIPNYLHEENDVITIEDINNGCSDKYQIMSFNIPIKPSVMTITAKKIRQVL